MVRTARDLNVKADSAGFVTCFEAHSGSLAAYQAQKLATESAHR